ncbi:uncharacterized protein K441DRAFT_653668 [Cenococcum geophilum 1.58]|uniref:uncharacterized protein n=1 Tax=Cenococcum geophilum 1.58 TaxID=794803 RepID=UPI00358EBE28|nr:hypothetical protein K441DRAFT_653668 [Cenococcum geophilum 1.58]
MRRSGWNHRLKPTFDLHLGLLGTNSQIHWEASSIFYGLNGFKLLIGVFTKRVGRPWDAPLPSQTSVECFKREMHCGSWKFIFVTLVSMLLAAIKRKWVSTITDSKRLSEFLASLLRELILCLG